MWIQYGILVILGFFLASLMFTLVAPSFWRRAVRLTRKRMESSMPLSIAEIEADKDQLRASFAVKIRRLEAALTKTREKSAHQLVEISRLQMGATALRDEIVELGRTLDERRNAAAVFELTIKKRFPELEDALAAAQNQVAQRAYEIGDITNKIRRREEALALAQRSAGLQQAEIARLREAMEKNGAERSGRFKKRPSQWGLDEYRAEYDRLNVDLSKLREQLSSAYDREANQITFLKAELQQLAEQIMTAAAPRDADAAPAASDAPPKKAPARPGARRSNPERRVSRPEPWVNRDEEVIVESLDKTQKVTPYSAKNRSRNAAAELDNFANKSLEEVLEAALPLAGEAFAARGEAAPGAAAQSPLLTAIVVREAAGAGELSSALEPEPRAAALQLPGGEAQSPATAASKHQEAGPEQAPPPTPAASGPPPSTPPAASTVGAASGRAEAQIVRLEAALEPANGHGPHAAPEPSQAAKEAAASEAAPEDDEGGKGKRSLLERLRGVDGRRPNGN